MTDRELIAALRPFCQHKGGCSRYEYIPPTTEFPDTRGIRIHSDRCDCGLAELEKQC